MFVKGLLTKINKTDRKTKQRKKVEEKATPLGPNWATAQQTAALADPAKQAYMASPAHYQTLTASTYPP